MRIRSRRARSSWLLPPFSGQAVGLLLAATACSVDERQVGVAPPADVSTLLPLPGDRDAGANITAPPSTQVDGAPGPSVIAPPGALEKPGAGGAGGSPSSTNNDAGPSDMMPGGNSESTLEEVTLTLAAGGDGAFGRITTVPTELFACTAPPCSIRLPRGLSLVLHAETGYGGSGFAGWQSGPCSGLEDCTLRLDADTTLLASYAPANVAFVTSTRVLGDFGGPAQGDALCAARALAAGLSGTFRAWLSDSSSNAQDILSGSRGWVRPDGFPVIDTADDLLQQRMLYPILLDEMGRNVGSTVVWTGSNGGMLGLSTCQDWSVATATALGTVGRAELVGSNFSTLPAVPCSNPAPLYCFGVGKSVALSPTRAQGRRAFVTDFPFVVAGGIAAADAFCQTQANGFALTGSFKAVLNTSTQSAASRFDLAGPAWIRLDGMRLTATARDFFSAETWLTGVNVTPGGFFSSAYSVWAGGSTLLLPGTLADTCNDWTSMTGNATTGIASGTSPATQFYFNNPQGSPCSAPAIMLTCLEE